MDANVMGATQHRIGRQAILAETCGRLFYAVAVIFFGVQHLVQAKFVTRLMPPWPEWLATGPVAPSAFGTLLVLAGAGLCFRPTGRMTALVIAGMVMTGAVLLALPKAMAGAAWGGEWTKAGKTLALAAGALAVATTLSRPAAPVWWSWAARAGFGAFLILAGIQHFIWAKFVASLVPAWIPGGILWTWLTGPALIAGGLGLWLRRLRQPAAYAVAGMIFAWVLLLHVPRVLAAPSDVNEATSLFEALAFSGIALMLASPGAGRPVNATPPR